MDTGNRETTYGHKIFLTGGQSGLIPGCLIEPGNPADTSMFVRLMDQQNGGFASETNLQAGKS